MKWKINRWFLYVTMGCQINVTWQILNEHAYGHRRKGWEGISGERAVGRRRRHQRTAIDGRAKKVSHTIVVMFYLKWTSHCILDLRLHFRCDKKKAMRNWFLQKKLTIVYIYYWKVWSIVLYSLKQNHECAIINYLCTVCLLSSTENSKYTLSWY